MVKLIVMLKRKAGITRAEFSRYWREVHARTVLSVPESSSHMARYVQNHIVQGPDSGDGAEEGFDGIFEGWYESHEALARVTASQRYHDIIRRDELEFVDHARCVAYVVEEHTIIAPPQAP